MILIELHDNEILMTAPLVSVKVAKEIPGGKYDKTKRVWRYPLSWATCVMIRGVFGDDLVIGDRLAAWSREEYATRVRPALETREAKE